MKPLFNFLLFVAVITISNPTYAQIDLGLIGGINLTTNSVSPSDEFDPNNRLEYGAGVLVNIPVVNGFSIQAQPMYLRKGSDLKIDGFVDEVSVLGTYIEVPVFARFTFESETIMPYIIAGPSVGFLLSAKQTASFIPDDAEDIKDDTNSIDFSLGIGAGVKIMIGEPSLYIQAKYLHGISNVDDDSSEGDFTDSIESRGIALMVGISFPIGGTY